MALRPWILGVVLLGAPAIAWAAPPKILELDVEKAASTTYFHVRLERPADLEVGEPGLALPWQRAQWEPFRLPRLVPQDEKTRAVYLHQGEALEFYGKATDNAESKLLLLYRTKSTASKSADKMTLMELLNQKTTWAEVPLTLDFSRAAVLEGKPPQLERKWAAQQTRFFAKLEAQTPEFGFYGLARELTAQKYGVPPREDGEGAGRNWQSDSAATMRRMYEVTTGAAAITESLALDRMHNVNIRAREEPQTVRVRDIAGIDIAEHPWAKMMGDKKPAVEPLACLVPNDNYYVRFKSVAGFLDTAELLDQWGTTLSRAMEIHSRDYQVRERLERQLCLKSSNVARLLGPAAIKSLAITGNDPYVRDGSDVTVIFHVTNRSLFLAAVDPFVKEAKTLFGNKLKEKKEKHRQITIESYVTPLREVSLHRAVLDDYVVYSNSPVGIRRVIDTYKKEHKALADSLDFQYMRTVFRADDPAEDGFAFLPDAFIRNLVGPATRIKQKRRLEALTSMAMINNGALFTAWETGRLPANHDELLAYTGLKPEQLYTGDGAVVGWSSDYKQAVSGTYNTLNFATPLIELPIDKATEGEKREYDAFRQQYTQLWRRYFDPVAIRLALTDKEIRWETYILPLLNASEYNQLRQWTGNGTVELDPRKINDRTIAQFLAHREIGMEKHPNWISLRFDDSPLYAKLLEVEFLRELGSGYAEPEGNEITQLVFSTPITVGGFSKEELAEVRAALSRWVLASESWQKATDSTETYKGVTIEETRSALKDGAKANSKSLRPSLFSAKIADVYYLSTSRTAIHDEIDGAEARKKDKGKVETVPVNGSLYVSSKAGVHLKEVLRLYLELETHRRALDNANLLYPLYRGGIISGADDAETIQAAAMKYLGCVPVSPDYAPYSYDRRIGEVINKRHGSVRLPNLHNSLAPNSPAAKLLDQFRFVRADLRFREDGVHTTVTLRKQ